MNPSGTLQLRDIHLPDSMLWWPPAFGWWLVACLIILILVGGWLIYRRTLMPSILKSAKAEIALIFDAHQSHQNSQELIQQLSIALRRIGISYSPRYKTAGLTGDDWYQQLNQLAKGHPLSQETIFILQHHPYQKGSHLEAVQIHTLQQQIKSWVSALSVR